jgi:hypothetical protein
MVTGKREGDNVILTFGCGASDREGAYLSQSGKTKVLATSHGFTLRFGDVSVSVTATIPKE